MQGKQTEPTSALNNTQPASELRRPSRLVLTHWSARGVGRDGARQLVDRLLLLSLFYDEILIQDEVLAVDGSMAREFTGPRFRDLENVVATGAVKILRHPVHAYPTEELRELARDRPMLARARQIGGFASKYDMAFAPTDEQVAFHARVDGLLLSGDHSREVNSAADFPIFATLELILRSLLTDHRGWAMQTFRLPAFAIDEVSAAMDDPLAAVQRMRSGGIDVKYLEDNGRPVVNRSLLNQMSRLFAPKVGSGIKALVQTSFAAPFAWREGAVGTYGRGLRELILADDGAQLAAPGTEFRSPEVQIRLRGALPTSGLAFGEIIAEVRNSAPGIRLREAVSRMGDTLGFREQQDAWQEVMDGIADRVEHPKPVSIIAVAGDSAAGFMTGLLIEGAATPIDNDIPIQVVTAAGGALTSAAGRMVASWFKEYQRSSGIRADLERAITFRCSGIDVPPFLAGIVPPGYGT